MENHAHKTNFQFNDLFEISDMQRLQELFSDVNGVASIITLPDGTPITQPSNWCRLCKDIVPKSETGLSNCFQLNSIPDSENASEPIVKLCSNCGLLNTLATITVGGNHIANWYIGQVRNEEIEKNRIIEYAHETGVEPFAFEQAIREVPIMSKEQFTKIAQMLFAFANEYSEKAYSNHLLKIEIEEREKTNKFLIYREQTLNDIINLAPDAFFQGNSKGYFIAVNEKACELTEYQKEELLTMSMKDLFSQSELNNKPLRYDLLEKGEIIVSEREIITKTGSLLVVEMNSKKMPNGTYQSTFRNITERKQIEQELQENQLIFSEMFQKSPVTIVLTSPFESIFLDVNENFVKDMEYTRDEVVGHSTIELNVFNDLHDREIINEKLRNNEKVFGYECKFRSKNGRIMTGLISISFIKIKGKICQLSTIIDITEKVRSNKALHDIEKRSFRAIAESPFPIIIHDEDDKVLQISAGWTKYSGYTSKDIPFFSDWTILAYGEKSILGKEYFDDIFLINRTVKVGEWNIRAKDGSNRIWEIQTTPLGHNENGKRILLSMANDITDQLQVEVQLMEKNKEIESTNIELLKAKEKAEESDRLKSAFLANMSHEIRTPMNGILGFAGLLKEAYLNGEDQKLYIEIIEKSGARMLNIINDIISISKVEAGQMDVTLSETSINDQIEYILTFFKPEASQKGVELKYNRQRSSTEALVFTDREKLYAILTNLVKNALKFTRKGSIEIGYTQKETILEFYVKDTGCGINEDQLEIIFERFRQGSESLTRNYEGAGLGLAICRAYVELLRGKIWVESKLGKGSIFYFEIPCQAKSQSQEKASLKNVPQDVAAKNRDIKILIAEDDEISKVLLTAIVFKQSKDILFAKDGVEVVNLCREYSDIDLILMDIKLPLLDGYEATKQIRTFNKEVIIIAQTAFALAGERETAIDFGCNDYISKPIDQSYLLSLIAKYFSEE